MDKDENIFNGAPSNILACLDISGKSILKSKLLTESSYFTSNITGTVNITSWTLFVRDEQGVLFNLSVCHVAKYKQIDVSSKSYPKHPRVTDLPIYSTG